MTSKVKTTGEKAEGVIVGFGGVASGITLYLENGVPVFDYNYFDEHTVLRGDSVLPADEATIVVDFAYEGGEKPGGPATITLTVNDKQVAQKKMDATVPGRFGIDTFGIGEDTGQPVTPNYQPPFEFTGEIESVQFQIN